VQEKVINWLLDRGNPSVRYLTLTSLLGRSPKDQEVKQAKNEIMSQGIVPKILELQNEDGSWGVSERFYRDKYRGTTWNLLILAEMAADSNDRRIKNACEFILQHSQDPLDGGFSYDQSKKTGFGLASGVVPCLTGNMVYTLVKFGYMEDERIKRAIDWICKYQRTDDMSYEPPLGNVYERYQMCWGTHSCHMGVAKALKALTSIPASNRNPQINGKIKELSEYFLNHHIYKKSHHIDEIARPGWLKFGFPLMYQTDALELLEMYAVLKIRDARLNEAINLVKSKRMVDGTWKLENTFNGKLLVEIEKKGQSSRWITLRALRVLKHFEG